MTDANNCYKILNIDINPLKGSFDEIDPRKSVNPTQQIRMSTTSYLNPDLISFFSNNNIKLANFFYASNTFMYDYQSGPTYTAHSDGNFADYPHSKSATIEWNFSNTKVSHVFFDSANCEPQYDVTSDDTIWSNCTSIIASVTPDDKPILFNCQVPSIDNKSVEQTGVSIRQKKISLVFIVVEPGDPNANNLTPDEITFAKISEKLQDYIVE